MKLIFISIAFGFIFVSVNAGQLCHSDSECASGECCQILSEFMVVSKRQMAKVPVTRAGTCEQYQPGGATCGPFDKMNGYCSCAPGLECNSHLDPSLVTLSPGDLMVSKRKMRPGYISTCMAAGN